ncbi:hypothetical protein [Deinococcus sp. NW-56]|uniref:hypothetical protein n=1 Tax=Deinococcus sp. NW-56 TaxID=2080419 RepID=UPI00131A330D|nr:hypothetical protein [Deinococcus sp. NW-56]
MTLWSVLGLFAAVALLGYSFLDTAFAGDVLKNSDVPQPRVDRVRYTLAGLTYLHGSQVVSGPHRSLPLILGWLALTALLMWGLWRRWALFPARRALRVSVASLALVVLLGGPALLLASWQHNRLLRVPTVGQKQSISRTTVWPHMLHVWHCGRWVEDSLGPACQDVRHSTWPNPTLWAVMGVLVTAGAGLWRPTASGP